MFGAMTACRQQLVLVPGAFAIENSSLWPHVSGMKSLQQKKRPAELKSERARVDGLCSARNTERMLNPLGFTQLGND